MSYPRHLVTGFISIAFFNFVLQWPLGSLSVLQLLFFRSCRNLLFSNVIVKTFAEASCCVFFKLALACSVSNSSWLLHFPVSYHIVYDWVQIGSMSSIKRK